MLSVHSGVLSSAPPMLPASRLSPESQVKALSSSPLGSAPIPENLSRERPTNLSTSSDPKAKGVQAYQQLQGGEAQNPYASKIVEFMGAQLSRDKADGASNDQLETRLAAGLRGFNQGYNAALDQLKASGLLDDTVQSAVADLKQQVLAGMAGLAHTFGLELPAVASQASDLTADDSAKPVLPKDAPEIPVSVPTLQLRSRQSTMLSLLTKPATPDDFLTKGWGQKISQGQARDFSFHLTTQEGDTVTIRASGERSQMLAKDSQGLAVSQANASRLAFSIDGELNEQELKAINGLLDQVGRLSDTFFNGKVEDAFQQALKLGFDDQQISDYALSLTRVDVQKVQNAYGDGGAPASLPPTNPWVPLSQFVRQLKVVKEGFEDMGLTHKLLVDLARSYSSQGPGEDDASLGFAPLVQRFIDPAATRAPQDDI